MGFDEETVREAAIFRTYSKNFENHYGGIDPNHTWGLYDLPVVSFGASNTRAGDINVNRNEWAMCESDGRYKEAALAKTINVPGWPGFDGYYYAATSAAPETYDGPIQNRPITDAYRPVGDITETEIQYVSEWFRTHKNPKSIELHLSDFFIQNVCSDHDQVSYPNGANMVKASDGWGKNITSKEGSNEGNLDFKLDHLCFKAIGDSDNQDTWLHVNNFNAGATNKDPENNTNSNLKREIQYITSSGTEDFACRPSFGTSSSGQEVSGDYINSWVLVQLSWPEVGADGKTYTRTGYYLAFDYKASKDETTIECDGYYSNWIVKITPAHFTPSDNSRRIMCEDLGNTYDFDFNDVVFDVFYKRLTGDWDGDPNATFEAVINLQAAGGTMPIYVGKDPSEPGNEAYEAHALLGNDSKTPVNVIPNGTAHEVATYRIKTISTDPGDIVIYVVDNGHVVGLRGNLSYYDGIQYKGDKSAPERFAVPTTVSWMQELKFIETGYKKFGNWAKDENSDADWYLHPESDAPLYVKNNKWGVVE